MTAKTIKTLLTAATAAAALGFAPAALAQDYGWDANNNRMLEGKEYNDYHADWGAYDSWDANRDGSLDRNDWNEGVYSSYDTNDDDILDEDEQSAWNRGYNEGVWE